MSIIMFGKEEGKHTNVYDFITNFKTITKIEQQYSVKNILHYKTVPAKEIKEKKCPVTSKLKWHGNWVIYKIYYNDYK